MRARELTEAPISNWDVDPYLDQREQQMLSQQTGYARDRAHYDASDKAAIRNPATIQRVQQRFLKVPYDFNFFFGHGLDPDYDTVVGKGKVDMNWVGKNLGSAAGKAVYAVSKPNNITIIFTNNLSDDTKVNLKSAWIYAHRISHAFINSSRQNPEAWDALHTIEKFVENIAKYAYGVKWPRSSGNWEYDEARKADFIAIYTKVLAGHLATMNSARQGLLVNPHELIHEMFAQWLLTGKITLNELPAQIHDEEVLTTDPEKLAKAQRVMARFPRAMALKFSYIMAEAEGGIWVV